MEVYHVCFGELGYNRIKEILASKSIMGALQQTGKIIIVIVVFFFLNYIIFLLFGWGFLGGDEDAGRSTISTILYFAIQIGISGIASYAVVFQKHKKVFDSKGIIVSEPPFFTRERKKAFSISTVGSIILFIFFFIFFSGTKSSLSVILLVLTPAYPFMLYAIVMGYYRYLKNTNLIS